MNTSPNKTDPEMWAAWLEFKASSFYGNIIQHVGESNEGPLWGVFYIGYEKGKAQRATVS